ncbi:ComF family protein [Advenella kashmirensis]|nr:phosphoribosyltransferase family protein [Advenella kashmirensis]
MRENPYFSTRFSVIRDRIVGTLLTACPLCGGAAPWGQLCAGCTQDVRHSMRHHRWRCPRCALALPANAACPDCAGRPASLEKVVAAFDYVSPADSLILRYKNARQFYLATCFAALALSAIQDQSPDWPLPPWPPGTPLIPIPGSRASLRRRGFNPASEFAAQLGRRLHSPVLHTTLYREPDSLKQSTLNRQQRQANTAHLYYCARNMPEPCAILVDDVLTTGSTLHAAANALRAAGVQRVYAVVIARTPMEERPDRHLV